ncbi:MAG: hypothetical protein RBS08_01190 [Bdellovibrionales bacterium]|jgi:hypothetical protein|nr:hypothetical protein [Bdellovibrionales bacterium]
MFKGWFNKAADSFDDVKQMTTRKLPFPGLEGSDKFIQLTAKRTREGYWTISSQTNIKTVTGGVQDVSRAYRQAVSKYTGRSASSSGEEFRMNFDAAFLILRDMEESLIRYKDSAPTPEPDFHYMAAYRLLPQAFREQMDDIFHEKHGENGGILPAKPKPQSPANSTPPRNNGGNRPN